MIIGIISLLGSIIIVDIIDNDFIPFVLMWIGICAIFTTFIVFIAVLIYVRWKRQNKYYSDSENNMTEIIVSKF